MVTSKTKVLALLISVVLTTLIGSAAAADEDAKRGKIVVPNFVTAAKSDTLLSARSATIDSYGRNDRVVSLDQLLVESERGLMIHAPSGFYYPKFKQLSLSAGFAVRIPRPRFLAMGDNDPPGDAEDEILLTCKNGKVHRNGQNTNQNFICVEPGMSMTCDLPGDGATFDFADERCTESDL